MPDLSQYDVIFIGSPVWWSDWPMIMYTFFENNEEGLAGKTLIPFVTHAGGGLAGLDKKLALTLPLSRVEKGLAIFGSEAQNNPDFVNLTVINWLESLGF
jgi:flavodoxin